jgi:hypothetical protein
MLGGFRSRAGSIGFFERFGPDRTEEGMMGAGYKLGEPVEAESGMRLARRWRLLLAHDATATTCDPLVDAIEGALGNVDINESSSVDDARVALHTARFDVCLVCLDLPPAPLGGVKLAQEVMRHGVPVVLVTRSLRWIPPSAAKLREVPWVSPDAAASEVARAVGEAVAALGIPAVGAADDDAVAEAGR